MTRSSLVYAVFVCASVVCLGSAVFAARSSAEMTADLERAVGLIDKRRPADALPILQRIGAENPDFVAERPGKEFPLHIAAILGEAYYRTGHWAEAIAWLQRYYPWQRARWPSADSFTPSIIADCRSHMLAEGAPTEPLALVEGRRFVSAPELSIQGGASTAPLRRLCEDLAASVTWDDSTQSATASLGPKTITFTLGTNFAAANGRWISLPAVPYLNAEWRMVVPVRPLVEALGGEVRWEPEAQMIHLTLPQQGTSPAGGMS